MQRCLQLARTGWGAPDLLKNCLLLQDQIYRLSLSLLVGIKLGDSSFKRWLLVVRATWSWRQQSQRQIFFLWPDVGERHSCHFTDKLIMRRLLVGHLGIGLVHQTHWLTWWCFQSQVVFQLRGLDTFCAAYNASTVFTYYLYVGTGCLFRQIWSKLQALLHRIRAVGSSWDYCGPGRL